MAGGIPDLEFDGTGREIALLGEEGCAYGGLFILLEVIVDEAHYQRGLDLIVSVIDKSDLREGNNMIRLPCRLLLLQAVRA